MTLTLAAVDPSLIVWLAAAFLVAAFAAHVVTGGARLLLRVSMAVVLVLLAVRVLGVV